MLPFYKLYWCSTIIFTKFPELSANGVSLAPIQRVSRANSEFSSRQFISLSHLWSPIIYFGSQGWQWQFFSRKICQMQVPHPQHVSKLFVLGVVLKREQPLRYVSFNFKTAEKKITKTRLTWRWLLNLFSVFLTRAPLGSGDQRAPLGGHFGPPRYLENHAT